MNELTTRLQEIMVPKAALIAYAYDSNTYRTNDKYYLELRPISPDGRMGAAIPVSHEFIGALADNYSAEICRIPYGRIPPNLLECNSRKGHEKYVWYNPPGRHRMFFTGGLNIADGEFNLPGVVYKVEKEQMDIYAFKGDRLEERTELYRAPFFNVTQSKVCLGSTSLAVPQNPTYADWLAYWEKRFWTSEFSHLGGKVNPTRSNLVIVTENARNAPFDEEELQPLNIKLKDLLS